MIARNVFVTVGTTKFDKLIATVTKEDTLRTLKTLGCERLVLQIGSGVEPSEVDSLSFEWYRYKSSIAEDIDAADLVISHAGAGSCLEVLGAGKQLLVVVNEDLMDDHQRELADRLASLDFCSSTIPEELAEVLLNMAPAKPYVPGSATPFARFIDSVMGFS